MKNPRHPALTPPSNRCTSLVWPKISLRRCLLHLIACGLAAFGASSSASAQVALFSNGFESDLNGWFGLSTPAVRVPTGSGGIASASGAFHATVPGTKAAPNGIFTRFGEYRRNFPSGGYTVRLKIYLDVAGGWANDTRFDWDVAASKSDGSFLRDFAFSVGFYTSSDVTGPGAGTDRFVMTASNNAGRGNADPKNPARSPIAISTSGWYTFEHTFYDAGGVLTADLKVIDATDTTLGSWTLSNPTDLIATVAGGNRYGWLLGNEVTNLPIDDAGLEIANPAATPPVFNATQGWYHATIQGAVTAAVPGDVIEVSAGTYAENVTIDRSLDLRGPNFGVSPNGGVRVAEAVVVPATTNTTAGSVFTVSASDVTIRGFTIDGDNTTLPGSGVGLGGAYGLSVDASNGVYASTSGLQNVVVEKNIVKNLNNYGVRLQQATNYFATTVGAQFSTGNRIDDNLITEIGLIGVRLNSSMYTAITNNVISNVYYGIYVRDMRIANLGATTYQTITGNVITSRQFGIWFNLCHGAPYAISNNEIYAFGDPGISKWYGIMFSTVSAVQNATNQLNLPLVAVPVNWSMTNNVIDGAGLDPATAGVGYWLWYVDNNRDALGNDHFNTITGGSVSNVDIGLFMTNVDSDPATGFGQGRVGAHASISGVDFLVNAGGTGIYLRDDPTWAFANIAPLVAKRNVKLALGTGVTVTGGSDGLVLEEAFAEVTGLSDLAFSGQAGNYIELRSNAFDLDGTAVTFDGSSGSGASVAQNFAIEDKVVHKIDDTLLGLVRVKSGELFVTLASGTTNGAIDAASDGDIIHVEAGVPLSLPTEITKDVTFDGSFSVTASSIPTDPSATPVLTSFMTRKGTSTVGADLAGMNANQIAAVNANFGGFSSFSNAPVAVNRGGMDVAYFTLIQPAVSFAIAGDVVKVAPGTYVGNVAINKNLTLESTGGRDVTTIQGVSGVGSLGAVVVSGGTSAVTIGGVGKGFTILGIDNGSPGLENAALYFQGGHTGAQVLENDIRADGDHGLLSEYGALISAWVIDGNIFSGKTFVGANPADFGFGNQFSTPNVPRQLVTIGNGGGNVATATATNLTFTNNVISGAAGGINLASQEQGNNLVSFDAANSVITGNTFSGVTSRYAGSLRVRRPGTSISGNTFDSTGLSVSTSQLYVENSTTPLQQIVAANTFDKGVYVDNSTTVGFSLQGFVDAYPPGTTIHVLPGSYVQDVSINKAVTLLGAGCSTTTIYGKKGGDGATVRMGATGAVIEGFTITREGNNTTDWNDGTLNNAGVAVQTVNGVIIRNNCIVGNRTGIDINHCSGHTILNNVISNNRTGMLLRNQTDDLVVQENVITDNWTVGILFLDASSGTNSPLQTAANCSFFNNNISGNWYGQIVDRQSGGSLPAPGTTNLKNFSGNWLGTATPVVASTNSAEPGYAAQIPVVFGGTAVPPVVPEPDILGAASANLDVTPLLGAGTDTDVETTPGRGVLGFQGSFDSLYVLSSLAQTGSENRINEALALVTSGGSIVVEPGAPVELATVITQDVEIAGTFVISATSIPADANADPVLFSFLSRLAPGSVVTAAMYGMSQFQVDAVNAYASYFSGGIAVQVYRGVAFVNGFSTIQAAIDDATTLPGDVAHVMPGIYAEDVTVSKAITIVSDAGCAATTILGQKGGDGATVRIAASGAVIDGFTITRDGNNTTDWNDSALNLAGIAIQSVNGAVIRNNCIVGNRTGVDINNCSGHTLRNNVISDNRTGLLLRNQTDDLVIEENVITDNWTVGVVFLDASSGTNVPVQSAANCSFFNNNISGNWYGQIVDRQSGGSLPAPGTTNLKNFSGNWLGTATPVVVTTNSAEPGYAAQIPVAYGGTAVPPVIAEPDVLGAASANLDLTPLLGAGTDSDIETTPGRGTLGFQGTFDDLHVLGSLAQTGAGGRIQEAMDLVSDGGAVSATAGAYAENVSVTKRVTFTGAGSDSNPAAGTVITSATGSVPVVTVSASGMDGTHRLSITGVRVTGATGSANSGAGILVLGSVAGGYLTFDDVAAVGNQGAGIAFNNTAAMTDVVVSSSILSNNGNGLRIATASPSFDGLLVDDCTFENNQSSAFTYNPSGVSTNVGTNFTISDTTFNNNSTAGVVNQHDLSFFGFHGNATLSNVQVTSGNGATANSNSYGILFSNASAYSAAGTISLTDVTVSGHVGKGALSFQFYNDVSNISLSNVDVSDTVAPWGQLLVDHTGSAPLALGSTRLRTAAMWASGGADATSATFEDLTSGAVLSPAVLADDFVIEDQIVHKIDLDALGLVRWNAGHLYVSLLSFAPPYTTTPSVERAISASTTGDVIHVQDGVPLVLTAVITADVTFDGNFVITSSSLPTGPTATAVLTSFLNRLAPGATAIVDLDGMTPDQIAAVSAMNAFPTVANAIPAQIAVLNTAFTFAFDGSTFADADLGQTLRYEAFGMPAWMSFNPATRTFSGTPTFGQLGDTTVTVKAWDDGIPNLYVTTTFVVTVLPAPPLPLTSDPIVSGAPAPEMAGQSFSGFFDYSINANGNVLAHILTSGPAGTLADAGVFSDASGTMDLLAREGDAMAPGTLTGTFMDMRLSDTGKGFFLSLTSGVGVTTANDYVGFVDDGLAVNGYAREGGQFSSLPRSLAVQSGGDFACFPAILTLGPGVSTSSDSGIFTVDGNTGLTAALANEGAVITGAMRLGNVSSRVTVSANGVAAFQAALTGVPLTANAGVFKKTIGGSIEVVALKAGNAPGVAGAVFNAFAGESIDPSGNVLIEATLKANAGLGINTTNDEGLWAERGGSLELVIREGDAVGGAQLSRVDRHVYLADGTVVARGILKGAGVGTQNDGVVFAVSPLGMVSIVLREGDPVADFGGSQISVLTRFDISPAGEWVTFFSLVNGSGDTSAVNNIALAKGTVGVAAPSLTLRKGDAYYLSGQVKTLYGFLLTDAVANTAGGTGGHGSAVNDAGQIAAGLYFSDSTQGIFVGP